MIENPGAADVSNEKVNLLERWIFVLLYSDSMSIINGRIRFTNYLFLILKKFDPEAFEAAEFYPHYFGPNSKFVAKTIGDMFSNGLIEVEQKNQEINFSLSEFGKVKAEDIVKAVDQDTISKISEFKQSNNSISLDEFIICIDKKYPEYTKIEESIIETVDLSQCEKIDDGPGFVSPIDPNEDIIIDEKTYLRLFL